MQGRRVLGEVEGRLAEDHKSLWLLRGAPLAPEDQKQFWKVLRSGEVGLTLGAPGFAGDKHPQSLDCRWDHGEGEKP